MNSNNHHHRGFASKFGFLMAAVGSAVGLGNLWGFPFRVYTNGGAAFVFIYIIMALTVGIIAMIGELLIGKRSQANVVYTFANINKKSKWLGYLAVLVPFLILCYYPIIGGWSMKYAYDYIFGVGVAPGAGTVDYSGAFGAFTGSPNAVIFLAVFMIVVFIIVLFGVKKGIEKASKVMMPLLFICLVAVVIYGLTLPNSIEGVKHILVPDFSVISENFGTVILAALGQIFFSMSLGMGINVAYGSYMGQNMKVGKSACLVGVCDTIMAVLAALAIFPALFSFGLESSATKEGPGLIFVVLANVFGKMGPVYGRIFGAVFFILVILAAVTSCIALLEVPVQFLIEKYNMNRKIASIGIAGMAFAIGSIVSLSFGVGSLQIEGVDLLTVIDAITNKMMLPVTAFATCIIVGWVIKPKNLKDEFDTSNGFKNFAFGAWSILIRFITPLGIAVVFGLGVSDLFLGKADFKTLTGQLVIFLSAFALIAFSIILNIITDAIKKKKFTTYRC